MQDFHVTRFSFGSPSKSGIIIESRYLVSRRKSHADDKLSGLFKSQLAITSVWKVYFQHFKHLSVANNEPFHMVHAISSELIFYSNLAKNRTRTMD